MGDCINVSIANYGSDPPVTRPETHKAGQSPRGRLKAGLFDGITTQPTRGRSEIAVTHWTV